MLVLMVVVTASHREINESVIVVELVLSKCQRRGLFFICIFSGFLYCGSTIFSIRVGRATNFVKRVNNNIMIKIFLGQKRRNGTSCYPNEFYRVPISVPRIYGGPIPSALFLITCFNELWRGACM